MRALRLELYNYIGIYNGLGLEKLVIDFTKAKHKICIICGPNGVGKTTIIKAIHPLPDSNSDYRNGVDAGKLFVFQHEDVIYKVNIVSTWQNNKRSNSAYISKNGTELNVNGNINSFKDIVFSELNIDPNYLVMTKISGDDKGIAGKTPAERKKLIASRIAALDVYNEMYRTLNKKANIFKSHLNSISSKLQNIGDRSAIDVRLSELSIAERNTTEAIEIGRRKIVEDETKLDYLDPTGEIATEVDKYSEEYKKWAKEYSTLRSRLYAFFHEDINAETIAKLITKKEEEQTTKEKQIRAAKVNVAYLKGEIDNYSKLLQDTELRISTANAKLTSATSNNDDDVTPDKINTLHQTREAKLIEMSQLAAGFPEKFRSESVEDLIYLVRDFLTSINNVLELHKQLNTITLPDIDTEDHVMTLIKDMYVNLYSTYADTRAAVKDKMEKDRSVYQDSIEIKNQLVRECARLEAQLSKSDKFPKIKSAPGCTERNKCELYKIYSKELAEYKSAKKELAQVKENLDHVEDDTKIYNNEIILGQKILDKLDELSAIWYLVKPVISDLEITKEIFNDEGVYDYTAHNELSYTIWFISHVNKRNGFMAFINNINEMHNNVSQYIILSKQVAVIDKKLQEYSEVSIICDDIAALENERERYVNDIYDRKGDLNLINTTITTAEKDLSKINSDIELLEYALSAYARRQDSHKKLKDLGKNQETIESLRHAIRSNTADVDGHMQQLAGISAEKKKLESQLIILEQFTKEYAEYKEKYDYVNILRKYSSPTQGGIQSVYISMYMNKTLDLSNQLLSMFFNGQYRILDYIINEDEFRIPFVGNGLVVDDISSGSSSQKSIMGSIISLVSSKSQSDTYNIASLDETDNGLDSANRMIYSQVISQIADILGFDQLFTISHSIESSLNNVDSIILSDSQEYKDLVSNTNVIYQYERGNE